jgi:hypothetical protein
MSQLKGDDIVLYTYEDLEPIACEESCILNIISNEIITTTRGSGRSINREYGSYDWNIQCNGVVGAIEFGKTNPLLFNDNVISGKKIIIKLAVGDWFYFGIGIITSCTLTGTSGEFGKFDVTISGDGELLRTGNLINTENEPNVLYDVIPENEEDYIYTSSNLINANVIMVFYKDANTYGFMQADPYYSFDDDTGTITFDFDVFIAPFEIKIFYVPG